MTKLPLLRKRKVDKKRKIGCQKVAEQFPGRPTSVGHKKTTTKKGTKRKQKRRKYNKRKVK